MTLNGERVLRVMADLEERDEKTGNNWFEAGRITKRFMEIYETLDDKEKPVMTISGFLTHLKREKMVEREVSTDKMFAWWRLTKKGKEKAYASAT